MHRYVVVDVETTGVTSSDRVVEIAALEVNPSDGRIVSQVHSLVNPGRPIGRAAAIHGITDAMVRHSPQFGAVISRLQSLLDGAILVAHNLPFDRRMLTSEFRRAGVAFSPGSGICTYQLTRQKLDVACRTRGIVLNQAHRAVGDATATALLFAKVYRGDFNGTPMRFTKTASSSPVTTVSAKAAPSQARNTSHGAPTAGSLQARQVTLRNVGSTGNAPRSAPLRPSGGFRTTANESVVRGQLKQAPNVPRVK